MKGDNDAFYLQKANTNSKFAVLRDVAQQEAELWLFYRNCSNGQRRQNLLIHWRF